MANKQLTIWLLLVACLVTPLRAATVLDASVIVRVPETAMQFSVGSGTVIDSTAGHSLILTNGHLFRDTRTDQVIVQFRDGRSVPGKLLRWSNNPDLALVSVAVESVYVAPLATVEPVVREATTLVGRLLWRAGQIASIGRYGPHWTIGGGSVEGDSGGGVFNAQGELVGVVWGSAWNETFVIPIAAVRSFVAPTLAKLTGGTCSWRRDPCGNWIQVCDQRPPTWTPTQQPTQPPVAHSVPPLNQPPAPNTLSVQVNKHETQLTTINQQITTLQQQVGHTKPCECGPKWTDIETRLNDLKTQIAASQSATATCVTIAEKQQAAIAELHKQLDHDTPVRVYLPDGKLAGEGKVNIFRGESIDFTFNPRALLDSTAGER